MEKMLEGQFEQITYDVYDNSDIALCAELICDFAVERLGSKSAAVYLFDRLTNRHILTSSLGPRAFEAEIPVGFQGSGCELAYRDTFECGAVLVEESPISNGAWLRRLAKLLVILYNRKFSFDMFSNSSRPIDFFQDRHDFYRDLCDLTRKSSQMPAGALRLREPNLLRTVFFWNDWNSGPFENFDWDIDESIDFPSMRLCLESSVPVVLTPQDLASPYFQRPMQQGVRAAILCPISVGRETIGTLSFALPIPYSFSDTERYGFLNLANSVGVSLTNFNQTASFQVDMHDDVRVSQVLTAVEVAQAARHSARADLDTLKTYINLIRRLTDKGVERSGKVTVPETIDECEKSIASCFKSLDDIKSAIRPPNRLAESVGLQRLFERAKNQLRGKIVKYDISVNWIGSDVVVECFPDHLTQVFLNLILNSVDAFTALNRKSNRIIRCRIHDNQEKAETIKIRIEDSAGGIDVAALRDAAGDFESSVEELVFTKDVTSKGRDGSGWGLYVSRKIVNDHGGHISLIEYRGRTVFEIELRKKLLR